VPHAAAVSFSELFKDRAMTAVMDGAVAAGRFGLGARPGELGAIGRDARGWILDQINRPAPMPPALSGLPPSAEATAQFFGAVQGGTEDAKKLARQQLRELYIRECGARLRAAIDSDRPVIERLVHFWSNHFTVSIRQKAAVIGIAGAFEREAIRPHVLGRFEDMLVAVVSHPAMLLYLDNAQSIGPNSRAGQRAKRGINENLARELMELHTLGVDGGYSQEDVKELAKILTGWSVAPKRLPDAGRFRFFEPAHEPGPKLLLGQRYEQDGQREGFAALHALASQPATARFVATKLARHFIADDPPAAAVARLAKTFRDSDGDLAAVTRTLVSLPEVWAEPLPKIKTPTELVVSSLRAAGGYSGADKPLINSLQVLDQPCFQALQPSGWPDQASAWIGPESLMRRVQWVQLAAQRMPDLGAIAERGEAVLGPLLAAETRTAIAHAPSEAEGFALLLASPEFQRR
jgi:uncharacterized protein (DUF1800 family)